MARFYRKPARKPPAGQSRNARDHEPHHPPAIKSLVKMARLVKLATDVARFNFLIELAKRGPREIAFHEGREYRFRGEHPRLDRGVNAFEPFAVEHASRITDDHYAVRAQLRHRVPPADRH